jgi:hypothetical protein
VIVSLRPAIAAAILAFAPATRPPGTLDDLRRLVRPVASHAYPDGAPPGFSGGFTEQSCDGCHFHAAPNSGPGRLVIDGVPDRMVSGEQYRVTISLTHTGMKLAGFQMTARFKDDGAQAGTLAAEPSSPARVAIDTQSGIQYAGHRREGSTVETPDESRWVVLWTAPPAGRAVMFHVAANAADGDERADGDFIYTLAREARN